MEEKSKGVWWTAQGWPVSKDRGKNVTSERVLGRFCSFDLSNVPHTALVEKASGWSVVVVEASGWSVVVEEEASGWSVVVVEASGWSVVVEEEASGWSVVVVEASGWSVVVEEEASGWRSQKKHFELDPLWDSGGSGGRS
ncbi:hypothetical protein D9C73_014452 [Collichthys lucidus]|uniref:Uncharacterized protein n=1 Tax=Collichthys lucidus TaxID=240159 RepID=A0A4U5UWT8_COLLU|nr:hypothetical protein D9C73_014452 [Collichthys lucidus]